MDPETFVRWAEEYFGKYNKMVKKEVLRKIAEWLPDELLALREEALRRIETQYKTAPDVYFIHHSSAQYDRDSKRQQIEREKRQLEESKERAILEKERAIRQIEYDKETDRRAKEYRESPDFGKPSPAEEFFKTFTKKMKEKADL